MNAEDPEDEELIAAWRRAGAEAGRPSDATRRAILAEARAAARRRQPAANESRYLFRAAAGVAVIGVALVLWRQMDTRLPGEAPVVATESTAPQLEQPAPEPAPAPPAPERAREAQRSEQFGAMREAQLSEESAARKAEASRDAALTATPPPPPPAPAAAAAAPDMDIATLVREHFSAQYQSDQPHALWLVLDAGGNVLSSGEYAPGQTLTALVPQLQRELGGRTLGPRRVEALINARGQILRVDIVPLP